MTLVSGSGDHLIDQNGKEYIDLMMGWCVGNLGWGHKEIIREITQYRGPDYVYPGFRFQPWEQLAGKLAEHAPGRLEMCYRATGGSESVDTALQIAMTYTSRKKIVSIKGAYHGNSISALSISDRDSRSALPNKLNGCLTIEPPLEESTLRKVETKLKNRDVAAFILEPVICNLGVLIPDKIFITGLREMCSHYGTLLIADEVACGFGRTGKLFACSHYGLERISCALPKR